MVVELKIKKKNPWAGLLKYKGCVDYISPYWTRSGMIYTARTLVLDDSIPSQALAIKFLSGHKRVATSLDKLTEGKDYLLINRQAEAIEANKINKQRREAIIEFGKLTLDQMRKCLRLFGINGERMSNELVESTLFNLVDKQPKKFFDLWVNNKSKDTQFILEEAIAIGVIRKQKTQYYYGTEMIPDSLSDAVAYLDNKKNQDLKLAIINETKNK